MAALLILAACVRCFSLKGKEGCVPMMIACCLFLQLLKVCSGINGLHLSVFCIIDLAGFVSSRTICTQGVEKKTNMYEQSI